SSKLTMESDASREDTCSEPWKKLRNHLIRLLGPVEEAKEPSDSFVVAVEEAKEPSDSFVVAVEEAKKSSDSFVVAVEEAKKSSDSFVVAVEEVEEAKKSSDSFVVAVEEAKEPSVNDAMEDSNESFSVTVVEDSLHNENRKFIEPSISEDFTSEKDVTLQNANNTTELKVEHAKKIDQQQEDPVESRLSIAEVATDSTQTVVERQESVVRVKTTASASSSAASSDPHHHRIANCSTTNSEDFDNASCNLAIADFNEDDEFDKASVASSINNRQVLPSLLSPIRSPDSETVDQPAAPSGESASRLKRRSFPVDDFVRDLNTSSAFRAVASAIPDAEPLSYLDRINAGIAAIIDNRDDNNSADCCLDDDELDYLLQPGSIAELCRGGGVQPPWIVSRLIPFLERLLDKTADRNKDSRIGSLRRRCLACLMIVGPLSPQAAAARSAVSLDQRRPAGAWRRYCWPSETVSKNETALFENSVRY
uniref:HECT domain-containing protein n=1 Tax=Macrostomum lignano TaxID=282301 RepID=A0A1I8FS52_9PLAT